MVKHVVMCRLKDSAQGRTRAENAALLKQKIEALRGQVPGLVALEVGIDFGRGEGAYDVALCAELESRAALAVYRDHAAHRPVLAFLREVGEARAVVDYEV